MFRADADLWSGRATNRFSALLTQRRRSRFRWRSGQRGFCQNSAGGHSYLCLYYLLADAGAMRRLVESREFRQLISGSTASTSVSILFDNTKHDSTRLRRVDVTIG